MLQLPDKSITYDQSAIRQMFLSRRSSQSSPKSDKIHRNYVNIHRPVPLCRIDANYTDKERTWKNSLISSSPSDADRNTGLPGIQRFKDEEQSVSCSSLQLTWAFANANINSQMLFLMFGTLIFVRYLTFICTIYYMIAINSNLWEIFCLLGATSFLYCTCMIKLSLKPAQTYTQITLKSAFNSLEDSEQLRIFEIVSKPKLLRSILRGMVPPQLSFLFIKTKDEFKRKRIYLMVNYIYCSIQAVVYIPGYLIYYYIGYIEQPSEAVDLIYFITNMLLFMAWAIFLLFNSYLICLSCRKKAQREVKVT